MLLLPKATILGSAMVFDCWVGCFPLFFYCDAPIIGIQFGALEEDSEGELEGEPRGGA